jgi:peptide/nickel transport system ATP-binding protein
MTTPILEIEDLNISFFTRAGEIPAVMDFSCAIMPGEAMGLVGESGCGKSTVALAVMRYLGGNGRITKGRIRFKGRDMAEMSPKELRRLRGADIAMIYQEPMASLNPAMIVGKQLMEVPMLHAGIGADAARQAAREIVAAVRLPDPARILRAYPHQLSGGQQQRIVIAMALMAKPSLLILDEPTTALDVTVEAGIVDLIKELGARYGTSILFISHNLGLVLETCDRICVMYSGEAVETGSVADVFSRMRHPYTQALFRSIPLPGADKNERPLIAIPGNFPLPHERPPGCNFGPRCNYFAAGRCDAQEIDMMAIPGDDRHASRCLRVSEIDWRAPPPRAAAAESVKVGAPVLTVHKLKKYYGVSGSILGPALARPVKANEAVSFEAREAEIVAIVGESGCGKSTLAKILIGLETATAGGVRLKDQEIGSKPIQERDAKTVSSIQMIFQNPFDTLNPSVSVGGQILRALEIFGFGRSQAERQGRMLELLDLVRLPRAFADRMPRQLSGGQKQRVGIARAFAGTPQVVVADEPVSALDVSVQAAVTELLMDIQRKSRTTMLFISHDLSVVRYLSDRVIVMYLGHIVEQGRTEDIFSPPYHPYTEALLSAVPVADASVKRKRIVLEGDIPSPIDPPSGCPFQTRCHRKRFVAGNLCEMVVPPEVEFAEGHFIKCHLSRDQLASVEPVFTQSSTPAA